MTFSFRSALPSPLPQRPPRAPRQLSKYAARQPTISLQHRAFTGTLLPPGREQREVRISHRRPRGRGRGVRWAPSPAGAPEESERQREASHSALLTPRPTRRARFPRGASAVLGEPEASRGCGGGASLEPTSFHPSPSWKSALLRPLKAPAGADSLPQGRSRQLPLLLGARALFKESRGWDPLRPHSAADSPQSCPDSTDLPFPSVPGPRPG